MICQSQAIVLNKINYSNSSLICKIFTVEFGKVSIIAKGARKKTSPNSAILQPLNIIDVIYYYKPQRNIQLLKETSLIHNLYNINRKYQKIICSLTIIDLINKISLENSPCEIIFRLIVKTLKKLDSCNINEINIYYLFFQIQFLIYMGYQPNFSNCYNCSKIINNGFFNSGLGQIFCSACSNIKIISINKDDIKIIQTLMKTHIDQLKIKISTNSYLKINNLLYKFILFHLPETQTSKTFKKDLYHYV